MTNNDSDLSFFWIENKENFILTRKEKKVIQWNLELLLKSVLYVESH